MLGQIPFGSTGHLSSRVIFGAAALGGMKQSRADQILELLLEFGVNHLDTAAMYGESELRLAPWLRAERSRFFVGSKTHARGAAEARESIQRSLERLGIDQLDLIQLHNLTDEAGWQQAMGSEGALEACVQAKEEGLVRFIGITGHGTMAPAMHLRSLEAFPFDSVLAPYNFSLNQSHTYLEDFERLWALCEARGVAVQTIKSIARRRWGSADEAPRFSWYEPLQDPSAIRRAVHYVLARPNVFLTSSSDARWLRPILEAAVNFDSAADSQGLEAALKSDLLEHEIEPIFVRGVSDSI